MALSAQIDYIVPISALPLNTQKQCTTSGSTWGLPSQSLTTKGSWIHLWGEGRQASCQPSNKGTVPQTKTRYGMVY